ncbi:MAG: asparagine synthase-related protein [Candidatus Korobacteraceae bacterium]
MVGSVRLDNADQLRKDLQLAPDTADIEIVLRAYARNGSPALWDGIFGEFAIAIWDPRLHSLFCCTDRLGIRPLYYRMVVDRFHFASHQDFLVEPRTAEEAIDPARVALFLAGCDYFRHSRSTCFKNVLCVRPGHFVALTEGRWQETRYWFPERLKKDRLGSLKAYSAAFKGNLEEAVRSRLPSSGTVWFDASGGIDSTSLIYLAHAELSKTQCSASERMVCRTIVPASAPEFSEIEYVEAALAPLRLEPELESFEDLPPISELASADLPGGGELALGSIALLETRRLCDRILKTGARVHLTGHGADHLLGAPSLLYIRSLIYRGSWSRAAGDLKAWATASGLPYSSLLLQWILLPRTRRPGGPAKSATPSWAKPGPASSTHADFEPLPIARLSDAADREWLAHVLHGAAVLRTIANLSEQFGVEKSFPYADIRLIELLLSMPAEERSHPPLPKWLLREAMTGVVPEKIRLKSSQPTGDAALILRMRRDRGALWSIVSRPLLAEFGLIEVSQLQIAFDRIMQGDNHEITQFVRFLVTEFWLRRICRQRTEPVGHGNRCFDVNSAPALPGK